MTEQSKTSCSYPAINRAASHQSTIRKIITEFTTMPNDNSYCQKMLILLGLMTVSVSLIVVSFNVALSNKTHKMLLEVTVEDLKTNQRAFRAAKCDLASCTGVKTVWKTWRATTTPTLTVTETKVVYISGRDRPPQPTVELEVLEPLKLVPHAMPAGNIGGAEKMSRQIVDVNKPEIQM